MASASRIPRSHRTPHSAATRDYADSEGLIVLRSLVQVQLAPRASLQARGRLAMGSAASSLWRARFVREGLGKSPTESAGRRSASIVARAYTSSVILDDECPRRCRAVLTSTPAATSTVAVGKRRSWNCSPESPAALHAGTRTRRRQFGYRRALPSGATNRSALPSAPVRSLAASRAAESSRSHAGQLSVRQSGYERARQLGISARRHRQGAAALGRGALRPPRRTEGRRCGPSRPRRSWPRPNKDGVGVW